MKFTIEIKDWKVVSQWIGDYLRSRPDWVYQISISKDLRTLSQLKYYFFILRLIGDELWYHTDELHYIMKARYDLDTTKDKSKQVLGDLIEFVRMYFLINRWISTPDPDPTRK